MAEIKSKAPLPLTMYKIESEVFSMRTKEPGTDQLYVKVQALSTLVMNVEDKAKRDAYAVQLSAICVRILEEVK